MKTGVIGPLPIGNNLVETVRNLRGRLQPGYTMLSIVVCDSRYVGLRLTQTLGVATQFVAPGDLEEKMDEGTFRVTYAYDDTKVDEVSGGHDGLDIVKPFEGSDDVAFLQDMRRK